MEVRAEAIADYVTSPDSYRKVAVAVSGAPLPAENVCQALLAWCLHPQPDHDAPHEIAVGTDVLRSKAKSEK